MEIERDVGFPSFEPSSRRESDARVATTRAPATTGLEVAYRRPATTAATVEEGGPPFAMQAVGFAAAAVVAGGVSFGLVRALHVRGGRPLASLWPHAFDGTSAAESGGVAMFLLVTAVALGWVGLTRAPRSVALIAGAGATLVTSLAMVTVALSSTAEGAAPPDGVLLVPYSVPLALVLIAGAVAGRAARAFAYEGTANKAMLVPMAGAAGAIAFVALELSTFAAGF